MRCMPPWRWAAVACLLALGMLSACAGNAELDGDDPEPGDVSNSFANALPIDIENGVASIESNLISVNDLDVFSVGPLSPGLFIAVQVSRLQNTLDPQVSVFDTDGLVLGLNDDFGGTLNSRVVLPLRRGSDRVWVVVQGVGNSGSGDYRLDVTIAGPDAGPRTEPQRVWVNFEGATSVPSPLGGILDIQPLNATRLGASGRRDELITSIMARLRLAYSTLNISISSSSDGPPPAEPFTTLYVGDAGRTDLLGVSETLDFGNQIQNDDAFVFTDVFADIKNNPAVPNNQLFSTLATSLANVAVHELGHTLGLLHVNNPRDVMEPGGTFSNTFVTQVWTRSPLKDVPLGQQDAVLTLLNSVGPLGSARLAAEVPLYDANRVSPAYSDADLATMNAWLPHVSCGTCTPAK